MQQTNQLVDFKEIATNAMTKSLAEMLEDSVLLNIVDNEIYKNHNCHLSECYTNTEYLNDTMDKISRSLRCKVVEKIKSNLTEFSHHEEIRIFQEKLKTGLEMDLQQTLT